MSYKHDQLCEIPFDSEDYHIAAAVMGDPNMTLLDFDSWKYAEEVLNKPLALHEYRFIDGQLRRPLTEYAEHSEDERHTLFTMAINSFLWPHYTDTETGEIVTVAELYDEWLLFVRDDGRGLTFDKYLENCMTSHNGTLERMRI